MLLRARIPREYIAPASAPQATRAADVTYYLEQEHRLEQVVPILEAVEAAPPASPAQAAWSELRWRRIIGLAAFVAIVPPLLAEWFLGGATSPTIRFWIHGGAAMLALVACLIDVMMTRYPQVLDPSLRPAIIQAFQQTPLP